MSDVSAFQDSLSILLLIVWPRDYDVHIRYFIG
jgi:hypothetical protein